MARRKKNKISPDELLFNFDDWTDTTPVEPSLFQQEQPDNSPQEQPNKALQGQPDNAPQNPQEKDTASIPVDLKYMEDSMFWALRQIDGIDDKNQTRLIAMETASVALAGISPQNIYQLQSYPYGKVDGYQLIALYYTSFAQVFPNMLAGIKLPYAPQFEAAQRRFQQFVENTAPER